MHETEFIRRFKPETCGDGSYFRQRYWHDKGDNVAPSAAVDEHRCWTFVDNDDGRSMSFVDGNRAVNHLYNIITELPYDPGCMYDVYDPDLLSVDPDDNDQ